VRRAQCAAARAGAQRPYPFRIALLADIQFEHVGSPGAGDVRILLTHRPDAVLQLQPHTPVDLVAAGHTHGGQVQVPLPGPVTTATKVPDAVAAGGLHDLDGREIYVSRGIGVERGQAPRVRFDDAPEISIIGVR
jgi:uncharacterized protein